MKKTHAVRRLFALLLVLCLALCGAVSAFAEEGDEDAAAEAADLATDNEAEDTAAEEAEDADIVIATEATAETADEEVPADEPSGATAAAGALTASFETAASGETVYPANFAGCWLENDTLVIALTTDDEDVQAGYLAITGNADSVRFVKAKTSMTNLTAYQTVGHRLASAYTSYVDVQNNVVILEVEESTIPAVWDALHAGIIPATFWGSGIPVLRVDDVYQVVAGSENVADESPDLSAEDEEENVDDVPPAA